MSISEIHSDEKDVRLPSLPGQPRVVFSAEQFQSVLQHERLRSDRSGLAFCMIEIDADWGGDREVVLDKIGKRVRATDIVGWLLDGRLGVIAPYTSELGALTLAHDLAELIRIDCGEPELKIHQYTPTAGVAKARDTETTRVTNLNADQANLEAMLVRTTPLWKRAVDVTVASIALVLLSPLFLLIPILIKILTPGPVFFVQWRTGLAGKPFRMFKFRTMVIDAESQRASLQSLNEQDGPAFKIGNDPRITSLGHWLRRLSIDELPQLCNVLRGEMSLVGPRPLPCFESDQCQPWQRRRLMVTPGMTCFWQTADRHTMIPFDQWMRMDVNYVDSRSWATDLRILFKTALFVIGLRGR